MKQILSRMLFTPAAICILFVALAGMYSVTTPIFEASDELWHYPFIKNIADGHGLPVQVPGDSRNYWQQEGSQPPLYYLLGALATSWIDTGQIDQIYARNPHATIGVPNALDNKNMVVHTSAEAFPYSGVPLAIHLVRFLSVLMGAATVYVTYLLALELFPGNRSLAMGAAIINASIPEFLFISGAINNDNLINLLGSAALLVIVRALKNGLDRRRGIALSIIVGLATLSKLSGLALLGLVVVAALIDAAQRRSHIVFVRWIAPVVAGTALIGGWWYLRNWLLYGDPSGLNVMLKIAWERPEKPGIIQLVQSEFNGFKMSFWAVFGGFNVLTDLWIYWVYDAITLVSIIGLATLAIKRRKTDTRRIVLFALCGLWVVLLIISLIRWTQLTLASQGRLIFPAVSVIAIALMLGIRSIVPQKSVNLVTVGLAIVMLSLATYVPFHSIIAAYPAPTRLSERDIPSTLQPLNVNYEGKAELLGYELAKNKLKPGEDLQLTLYWKCLSTFDANYSIFVHLFGTDNEQIGQNDSFPEGGSYPTSLWRPGDIIRDTHRLTIANSASTPSAARITVGVYMLPSYKMLRATDKSGKGIGPSPIIATIKLAGDNLAKGAQLTKIAQFENKISLVGYNVGQAIVAPGGTVSGSLKWYAETNPRDDLTVFVQMVGENGLVAQYDSQPVKGYYPTSLWETGELIDDTFQIDVGSNIKEGSYDLIAGLYHLNGGERLRVNDGTFVKLGQVTVRK